LGAADSDRRPVFNEDILDRKRNGWQRDLAVNGGGGRDRSWRTVFGWGGERR
jgi:hypothetical protein